MFDPALLRSTMNFDILHDTSGHISISCLPHWHLHFIQIQLTAFLWP